MKLTPAQWFALEVLADADRPVPGWKRSTRRDPLARLNMIAAASLCRLNLARSDWPGRGRWSPYTHDLKYSITEAGREALAEQGAVAT